MMPPEALFRDIAVKTGDIRIRKIGVADLWQALRRGYEDFNEKPSFGFFVVLIYPLIALLVSWFAVGVNAGQLAFPVLAGLTLLGPVASVALFAMSRRRELGLELEWRAAFDFIHSSSFAPIAALSGPASLDEGGSANFSGAASLDPNGTIVSYEWSFGDGSSASGVDALIGSASPSSPAGLSSTATKITVWPSRRRISARSARRSSGSFSSSKRARLPSATFRPSTVAATPFPVIDRKSFASVRRSPLSVAPATIAPASGCSLPRSRPAASRRSACSSHPASGRIVIKRGRPSVRVPVLSQTRVSTFSKTSSASAFLKRTPAVAPRPVATMIDIGVASPNAQGQAMIRTATALTIA